MLQKTTELGIQKFIPLLCERSVVRELNVERAEKIAPNLIGRVAPEFVDIIGRPFMKDPNGKTFKLSDVKSEYTILVFYAPDCGHCKKEIPRMMYATFLVVCSSAMMLTLRFKL